MSKHFKNLRFKPKDRNSFIDLQSEKIFSNIFNDKEYQYILAEVLIRVIRDLNNSDLNSIDIEVIKRYFTRHLRRANNIEYYESIVIPTLVVNDILNELYNIFKNKNAFSDFKGKVLEYYILYIEKYRYNRWRKILTQFKIFYECYPRYKRQDMIFANAFFGDGCDVDIMKVEKHGEYIKLIECKFNLDGNIALFEDGKNEDFEKKLNYMDNIKMEISNYENHYEDKVKVEKYLASFSEITTHLPSRCTDYYTMNVLEEFEKIVELQCS